MSQAEAKSKIALLETERAILRDALLRFVEVDGPELDAFEKVVAAMPSNEDTEKALVAIRALKTVPKK